MIIQRCLSNFCNASGQKINTEKSKLFYSRNVNVNRALQIGEELWMPLTGNLEKYFEIPIIHEKASKLTFAPYLIKQIFAW